MAQPPRSADRLARRRRDQLGPAPCGGRRVGQRLESDRGGIGPSVHQDRFSMCPPNSWRNADRSRLAKSSSPREENRDASAEVNAGAAPPLRSPRPPSTGPHPSRSTRPANPSSVGASCSAAAVEIEQPRATRRSRGARPPPPRRRRSRRRYRSGCSSGVVSASASRVPRPTSACARTFSPSATPPSARIRSRCAPSSRSGRLPPARSAGSPYSTGEGSPSRPRVRAAISTPGASDRNTGSSRSNTSSSAPTIRQNPRSSPNTPPRHTDVDVVDAERLELPRPARDRRRSVCCRRRSIGVPRFQQLYDVGHARSVISPAGSISHTVRGAGSAATSSASELTPVAPS